MPPRPKKTKKTTSTPPRPVVFFLALTYLLMALGDAVRIGFWWVVRFFFISYKKISVHSRSVTSSFTSTWMRMRVAISVQQLSLRHTLRRLSKIPKFPHIHFSLPTWPKTTKPKHPGRPPRQVRFAPQRFIGLHPFIIFFLGSLSTIFFIAIPLVAYLWLRSLPSPTLLTVRDLDVTTKVFDRSGALLYEIYADQNRTPLALNEIPKYVIQATIAIEDKNFYSHQGFSLSGITRAARETMLRGRVQGGSTITQQLIKSALLTPEVNLTGPRPYDAGPLLGGKMLGPHGCQTVSIRSARQEALPGARLQRVSTFLPICQNMFGLQILFPMRYLHTALD